MIRKNIISTHEESEIVIDYNLGEDIALVYFEGSGPRADNPIYSRLTSSQLRALAQMLEGAADEMEGSATVTESDVTYSDYSRDIDEIPF